MPLTNIFLRQHGPSVVWLGRLVAIVGFDNFTTKNRLKLDGDSRARITLEPGRALL